MNITLTLGLAVVADVNSVNQGSHWSWKVLKFDFSFSGPDKSWNWTWVRAIRRCYLISSLPTPVAMATNFETKLTITRHPWKIIASCSHLPPIFRPRLSDGVIWISPLTTPVAMATNFGTKIDSAQWKIIARCFYLHPYFRGWVSFRLISFRLTLTLTLTITLTVVSVTKWD